MLDAIAHSCRDRGVSNEHDSVSTLAVLGVAALLFVSSAGVATGVPASRSEAVAQKKPSADIIVAGSATPSSVTAGETVPNQRISLRLRNVSADGEPDVHYVELPNALARNLTVVSADVSGAANASVASGPTLVEGFDNDDTTDTVAFRTNATGGGPVNVTVATNLTVTYPSASGTYSINARVVDSARGTETQTGVATIAATVRHSDGNDAGDSPPTITDFSLAAADQDVDVTVTSTEDLEKLKVKVKSKTKNITLTREDFNVTREQPEQPIFVYNQDVDVILRNSSTGDVGKLKVKVKSKVKKIDMAAVNASMSERPGPVYKYRADVSTANTASDGTFKARLLNASSEGQDGAYGQTDALTIRARTLTTPTPSSDSTVVFVAGAAAGFVVAAVLLVARKTMR